MVWNALPTRGAPNLKGLRASIRPKGENVVLFTSRKPDGPCWAGGSVGADDEIRTRDPHLGKVMLYQLSYVRVRTKR